MPDLIIFNFIAVNNLNTNAAVLIGDNAATGWDSNNKKQSSIGTITGAGNVVAANLNLMNDNDVLDTPIIDNDIEAAATAQA